jgi:hypothetical protein
MERYSPADKESTSTIRIDQHVLRYTHKSYLVIAVFALGLGSRCGVGSSR